MQKGKKKQLVYMRVYFYMNETLYLCVCVCVCVLKQTIPSEFKNLNTVYIINRYLTYVILIVTVLGSVVRPASS